MCLQLQMMDIFIAEVDIGFVHSCWIMDVSAVVDDGFYDGSG